MLQPSREKIERGMRDAVVIEILVGDINKINSTTAATIYLLYAAEGGERGWRAQGHAIGCRGGGGDRGSGQRAACWSPA